MFFGNFSSFLQQTLFEWPNLIEQKRELLLRYQLQPSLWTRIVFSLNILLAKKKLVILQNWFGKIHEGWFLLLVDLKLSSEISQNIVEFNPACSEPFLNQDNPESKESRKFSDGSVNSLDFTNFLWCLVRVLATSISSSLCMVRFTKGQLISKCLFGGFNFFQKTNENTWHSSKNEFIRSFFGRIHGLTIFFQN